MSVHIITKVEITRKSATIKLSIIVWGIAITPHGTIDTICRRFCHFLVESHTSVDVVKLLYLVVKVK